MIENKNKSYQVYNKFDIKNFDVKTDGTPINYKPEYHNSNIASNIFPFQKYNIGT